MKSAKITPDTYEDLIKSELAATPVLTAEMVSELATANLELEADASFRADLLKSVFVDRMLGALEKSGMSKAQLADKMGKSRQYIQKLFDENRRVNFTIDTLCEIAHCLGHRVHLHVCPESDEPMILSNRKDQVVKKLTGWELSHSLSSSTLFEEYLPVNVTGTIETPTDEKNVAANAA